MNEKLSVTDALIGQRGRNDCVVARGTCPFCNDKVSFKQIGESRDSRILGTNVAFMCEGCHSILTYSLSREKLYPSPMINGISGLPPEIDKYYQEGLRCISADSPNGAATLFRKIIHAIGIHYGISKKNDDKKLYEIINELASEGYIIPKLRDALISIKDIGNDGAHINENEPDMEQALILKRLIDTVLSSTIIADQSLVFVREKHER